MYFEEDPTTPVVYNSLTKFNGLFLQATNTLSDDTEVVQPEPPAHEK